VCLAIHPWRLLIRICSPTPNGDRNAGGQCESGTRVVPPFLLRQVRATSPKTTGLLTAPPRPSCRRLPAMPSIRVKTSRSFYKTLEEEAPSTPAPPSRRPRSKSVIEVFSGTSFLQSPDPQSPRPQSHAPNLGEARLSKVSQQISNSSREALPGPPADPQYRGSNTSYGTAGMWDEDQNEAVIDHLDVIGEGPRSCNGACG